MRRCRWSTTGAILLLLAGACAPPEAAEDASPQDAASSDLAPLPDASAAPDAGPGDRAVADAQNLSAAGVEGRVCAPSGDFFLADAEVQVQWLEARGQNAVTQSRHARSGRGGVFRLRELPVGTFTFEIRFGRLQQRFRAEVLAPGAAGTLDSGLTDLGDRCFDGSQLKLAVVTGIWDSVETVIADVGLTDVTLYGDAAGWHQTFFDPALLAQYDALYFNCGLDDTGLSYPLAAAALRSYVAQGGSVYASDWAYNLVEQGWSERVDFLLSDLSLNDALLGGTGDVLAVLHGSAVSKTCGQQANISLDLPYWAVMERVGTDTELLASGTVTAYADPDAWDPSLTIDDAPLMVRFTPAQPPAAVVFTSFHNEAQATDDMLCILKTVILGL